jgi:phage tail-like protein
MSNPYFQTSFYFSLQITGSGSENDAAFQEASGLSAEMSVEEVVSGGQNLFKYRLPGVMTYPNLVLKRGIAFDQSPLIGWCQSTLGAGLGKAIQTKNLVLSLLDATGQSSMSWSFTKAYPIKWIVADLTAKESNVLIETIELSYQYFTVNDPRNS